MNVYALLKQVSAENLTDFTIHGVTENEQIADTWSAASDLHHSPIFESEEVPGYEGFELEADDETTTA